ncbi:NAD(P)-binding domain-containing protein [Streptomyces sp. NPDC051561]|uniref:NAD(P)-binding domain-containing protein n=1 Tax=Streptomyces sp. NPDC051561 TaxID=3365658 RepID=UPI0037ADA3B1
MSINAVVIGAGPYGLSTAAHLRARGLSVRVFGSPMASWSQNMPAGMLLKSPPSASVISAAQPGYTLQDYLRTCGERSLNEIEQVPIELFVRYGLWFQEQLVPDVDDVRVASVDRQLDGFRLKLSSGEELRANAVVVASGLTGFVHLPAALSMAVADGPSHLGPISHSSQHTDLTRYRGREVVVVGAGQSALESAALLQEAGADVRLLARAPEVKFGAAPTQAPHWQPDTPVGRSWSLYGRVHGAGTFRHLPSNTRLHLVRRVLGPCGAWWLKDRVAGRIPVHAARRIQGAELAGSRVCLTTRSPDGGTHTVEADHVLAATGYRVHLEALGFLSPELRARLVRDAGFPRLDRGLSSSVPGLYFTGLPAAGAFGPVLRFVCGTSFASPRVTASVAAHNN